MLRVTIWMNMPSPYQSDLFRALVDTGEVDLQVIFAHGLSTERKQIGWSDDTTGFTSCTLGRRWGTLEALRLARRQSDRIHIVNGLWAEPAFAAALCLFVLQGSTYIIYSEAPNPETQRSMVKRLTQTVLGRALASRATGWLPISRFAVAFYERLGVHREAMYPFGYFRARPLQSVVTSSAGIDLCAISAVFVGQLIERKGVDLLLSALANGSSSVSLQIIGDGALRPVYEQKVQALGMANRVVFEGVLPMSAVSERVARAHVLILPARWDGWGLVVNEALMVGVPVIVSDRCGAADLIHFGINGYIFRSGDVDDLGRCLERFCVQFGEGSRLRAGATATGAKISTDIAASYLIACLRHMLRMTLERPAIPWVALESEHLDSSLSNRTGSAT